MAFAQVVELAGNLLEGAGVGSIVVGAVVAGFTSFRHRAGTRDAYRTYREDLGKSILLGLEFLVAADIIRTVSHAPSLGEVAVLGGIVLIRTFLSFTLEVELEGRWPWQRRPERPESEPRDVNAP